MEKKQQNFNFFEGLSPILNTMNDFAKNITEKTQSFVLQDLTNSNLDHLSEDENKKKYIKTSYSNESYIDKNGNKRQEIIKTYKSSNGKDKCVHKKILNENKSHLHIYEINKNKEKITLKDEYLGISALEFIKLWNLN